MLIVKDLKLHIESQGNILQILRGVDFNLYKNEILGFAGESGCGKTLTALSIMKLNPKNSKITQGSILFNNVDLLSKNEQEMAGIRGKNISLIFQEPLTALNPCFTVYWQIDEILRLHKPKLNRNERKEIIIKTLSDVKLTDINKVLKSYPHQLSGGMRQRIVIAMAIICKPDIIIADEPTTSLDVTIQREILNLIDKIIQELKKTSMILISHDINILTERCNRIMIMYLGEIVEVAEAKELFNNPMHPYTKGLIKSTPRVSLSKKGFGYIEGDISIVDSNIECCLFNPRCSEGKPICIYKKPQLKKITNSNNHFVRCFNH